MRVPDACGDFRLPAPRANLRTQFDVEQTDRGAVAGYEKVFREKVAGTTADRLQFKKLMAVLAHGDVVIIPAVDRLLCDTTDILVIARDTQRAGAGLRSPAAYP
jgi:DNA invertase Pin-like site-specific DNA recombinase